MKCSNCGVEWTIPATFTSKIDVCPFCGKSMQPEKPLLSSLDDVLVHILKNFGDEAMRDGTKLQSLFADLAPQLKREKVMLRYFVECNGNEIFLSAIHEDQSEAKAKIKTVMDGSSRYCKKVFIKGRMMMEDKISANAEQIYYIARELEVIHESLRKAQYLLEENKQMCSHIGFVGADSAASELEQVMLEVIKMHQRLYCMLEEYSAKYMHVLKSTLPPTAPIKINFGL